MLTRNIISTPGSGRATPKGTTGSSRISPATVYGAAAAWLREISAIELPIRITGAPATSSMKRFSRAWLAATSPPGPRTG